MRVAQYQSREFLTGLLSSALLFLSATGCTVQTTTAAKVTHDLLIENVTAIDAMNGERQNVDVLIRDGLIARVGTNLNTDGAITIRERIDGSGKYLIPGLWDAHVHLTYKKGVDHQTFFPLSLAYGVTSLRDTGGHLDQLTEARAISDSDALAPNLYVSGPLIDGSNRVYAGQSAGFPNLSVGVGTASEVEAQVDQLAAEGVEFLKAYEMLSPTAFRALVDRAKYHNLPVTAHSPLSMTATQAIQSGIKDMQHLRNLEMDCANDPAGLLEERHQLLEADTERYGGALRSNIHKEQRPKSVSGFDENNCAALVAQMLENGVMQTPTLTITTFLSRKLYAEERWQNSFNLVPAKIAAEWQNSATALSKRPPTENDLAYYKWVMSMVSRLDKAGVPIIAGTDAPIGFLTPGASLHEELAMLVDAGLSPMSALRAATYAPAAFFGIEDTTGLIQAGMTADMVLLNSNPLTNIRNTQNIVSVFKDGRHLSREQLDRLKSKPSSIVEENISNE